MLVEAAYANAKVVGERVSAMQVVCHGAAGEVTGSCHVVEVGTKRILLDCGMIQGGAEEERRNRAEFPFDPAAIDAMILSHAHIDHCGRLPLLCQRGFRGPIYTHQASADLTRVMLEDAQRLLAADVEQENRIRQRRGLKPLKPLYELADVQAVYQQLRPQRYGVEFELWPGVAARLSDAGHILGAAIVELWAESGGRRRTLVFSGDIGPKGTPIIADPTPITHADLLLMESTYGDRLHRRRADTVAEIGRVLDTAWAAGGNVLIPAFAVGRSQELLFWFAEHYDAWQMGRWRIFLDSPMAGKVVEVYRRHVDLFDAEARAQLDRGRDPFALPNLHLVGNVEDSMRINRIERGAIIIAGSGMCNGGRIRHHLKHNLWRPQAQVLIVGFQAHNTLGRALVDGARRVRIFHESIRVNAQIHTVGGLSAHADQRGLLDWYAHFHPRPPVILVHGEDRARLALAERLRGEYGAEAILARPGLERSVGG